MDRDYQITIKDSAFRNFLVYSPYCHFDLLIQCKCFPYRVFIAKAFTCKTFGHITRTGYSHIFHITFQHRNAQSLEKASVCQ